MNTQKVLIATTNKGKLAELKTFLKDLPVRITSKKMEKHIKQIHKKKHCFMQQKANCQQ
jgi:inosine/xanthosine triphosphate pyrophosphatase family protein